MNIPNILSLSRIFLLPFFLYLLFREEMSMKIMALVVFTIASLTDLFDGWTARKFNQESELGKFLDPFTDKVLVISTLIAFLLLDPLIPVWMVIVIIGRDFMITILRYIAVKKSKSIRTSRLGKVKTAFQMTSIFLIIMLFIVRSSGAIESHNFSTDSYVKVGLVFDILRSNASGKFWIVAPYGLMLLVTILTAISGLRYLCANYNVLLPVSKKD